MTAKGWSGRLMPEYSNPTWLSSKGIPLDPAAIPEVAELPTLPVRAADSHKGSYGSVLVVAGSRGMSGAAVLCGTAALRGGAGLVCVASPAEVMPVVAAGNPCYTTAPLPQDHSGRSAEEAALTLLPLIERSTVIAVGPGLGQGEGQTRLVSALLRDAVAPVVVDADALNVLQQRPEEFRSRAGAPRILTPHPGEFGRLVGLSNSEVQARRVELAVAFAARLDVLLVLKGHGTLVTDGRRLYRNTTGNPGMATGGSGDVLTGLIAALLAQGLEPFCAAQLGVYLHGRAGDLAAEALDSACLVATDLLDFLPNAFRSHRNAC